MQEQYDAYQVNKAMNLLRKIQVESEVCDQFGNGEATQVHHITVLRAYDKSKDKRLLRAAQQLSDWLQDKEINDITPFSKDLCMLQIIKRQRELTFEEKGTLYKIAGEAENLIDKFSSLVLLDDEKSASKVLGEQCKKCHEYLMVQPIYNLYEKKKE